MVVNGFFVVSVGCMGLRDNVFLGREEVLFVWSCRALRLFRSFGSRDEVTLGRVGERDGGVRIVSW